MGDSVIVRKKPASVSEMNLKSIQRLDPCAIAVIDKSTHAALYRFDKCKMEWVKTAIEGPLFLYKRADKPEHSLMIANRQSLEDHIEPIIPPLRFFLEAPYIFMNTEEGDIRGYWFFEEEDCTRMYTLLVKLAAESSRSSLNTSGCKQIGVSTSSQNGYNEHRNSELKKEKSSKRKEEMPVLLRQLLSKEKATKLPDVPTRGAMSADEIEKLFLRRNPKKNGSAILSKENGRSKHTKVMRKHVTLSKVNEGTNMLSNLLNDFSLTITDQAYSLEDAKKLHQSELGGGEDTLEDANLPVAPLTKEQLLTALKHLLKDDGFVTRLHRAYLDSVNTRLGLRD